MLSYLLAHLFVVSLKLVSFDWSISEKCVATIQHIIPKVAVH